MQVCWHASNGLQNGMHCILLPQCCLKQNRKRQWDYRRHISFVYIYLLISPYGAHIITCVILFLKQAAWVHAIHVLSLVRVTPPRHEKVWLLFWRSATHSNSQSPPDYGCQIHILHLSRVLTWFFLPSFLPGSENEGTRGGDLWAAFCEQNDSKGTTASCIVWTVTILQTATYLENPGTQQVKGIGLSL